MKKARTLTRGVQAKEKITASSLQRATNSFSPFFKKSLCVHLTVAIGDSAPS
jgi:hypothetical protein